LTVGVKETRFVIWVGSFAANPLVSKLWGVIKSQVSPTRYLAIINVLSSALGFVQGIITARYLGPDSYGVIAVIVATNVTVLNFLDVRLVDLAGKLYYRPSQASIPEPRAYRASVLQICLVGNGLISLGLSVLGFLANLAFIRALTTTPVQIQWLVAQSLILAFSNWANSLDYLLRFSGRFYLMGTWRLVTRVANVGLFLAIFLPGSNLDSYYRALFFATSLGLVMTASVSALIWLRYEHLPLLGRGLWLAWPDYRRGFRFLFYGNLLGYVKMLHRGSDVLLIGFFADDRITGLYKLTRSLTDVLYILFDALNQVYYPRFMELLAQRAAAEYRRLADRLLMASSGFTLLVLVVQALLLAPALKFALANRFAGAESAIMVMTVPFLFVAGIYTWLWPLFVHSGKLGKYTVYSFLACFAQYAVALGLFVGMQPTPLAAALGYLAYYCVLFPLAYRVAQRNYAAYLPRISGRLAPA
jgi:O-antigen/teichoic acid export membrane protein